MANILTNIQIKHNREVMQTIKDKLLKPISKPREQAVDLRNFFNALAGGDRDALLTVQVNSGDAVAAHGTVTFASFVATNTFTIANQVFTAETSGATGQNQFNIGGSDTLSAAAAVVVINSNTHINQFVVASSSGAVITVTCLVPGEIGNYIALAISAHGSVSAATLASGANATTYSTSNVYHLGL